MNIETVLVDSLKPHPRNYRGHPDDQLDHLEASLRTHGFYHNVVVAQDGTILAGHGIVEAAKRLGIDDIPVRRLPLDPTSPAALKVLAGDNESRHLAEIDDRALSELLKQIRDEDEAGLVGTGYDDMMLANLVMVTRPAREIADFDEAAEWVGMPEYEQGDARVNLVINFRNESDRQRLIDQLGLKTDGRVGHASAWWPPKADDDPSSVRFTA